jgi:hypothetical protein
MMYVQLAVVVAGYGMWGGNLTIFEQECLYSCMVQATKQWYLLLDSAV